MKEIKIGNKKIGKDDPCFVIAEAGINHNGDFSIAKKLVDAAAEANADAVKFQTFKSEDVVINKLNQTEIIRKFELKYEDFRKLKKYCDNKKIIFLSTPHTYNAIDFLDELVPAYKFGSGDLTNLPALEHAANKQKPIILGTGMSNLKEIKEAIRSIKKTKNNKIIALHCTTQYPCPYQEVNLNAMVKMQKELDCMVGYSDHTLDITVPIMAATLGAVVIEKHLTLDRNMEGPDQKASLEPHEMKKMIKEIRNVKIALGNASKKPTESENKIKKMVRKSLVSKININKGTKITKDMIDIKRPGTCIEPAYMEKIIGKKAKKDIKKDELIKKYMVE